MKGWTSASLPSLAGQRVLVTGAASGLGLATARALASKGAELLLVDRDVARGRAAEARIRGEQGGVTKAQYLPLDLAKLEDIRQFAAALCVAGQPLHVLINIAGILPPPQRALTADGFELKFGVNVLGHFALTGLLLPVLLKAPAARVVNLSSITQAHARIDFDNLQAERRYAPQRVYGQAKLACLMLALELDARARAAGSSLQSIAAHPGIARTAIGAERSGLPRSLRDHAEDLALRIAMRCFGQSAEAGAEAILFAAAAPQAKSGGFYGPSGFGQFSGSPTPVRPARSALDPGLRQGLWAACEAATGVRLRLTD